MGYVGFLVTQYWTIFLQYFSNLNLKYNLVCKIAVRKHFLVDGCQYRHLVNIIHHESLLDPFRVLVLLEASRLLAVCFPLEISAGVMRRNALG